MLVINVLAQTKSDNRFRLEKAHLNLVNARTQLIVGLILVAMLTAFNVYCLVANGAHPVIHATTTNPQAAIAALTLSWEGYFLPHAVPSHLLTNFVLLLLICLFVALIGLELTGVSGNRTGAAAAVWAAYLFSLFPLSLLMVTVPEACEYELNCLFVLIAVFGIRRLYVLREKAYLWLSAGAVVLLAANDFAYEWGLCQTNPLEVFLGRLKVLTCPSHFPFDAAIFWPAIQVSYFLLLLLCLSRVFSRSVKPGVISLLIALLAFCLLFGRGGGEGNSYVPAVFYAQVPFSLALGLLVLPSQGLRKLAFDKGLALAGLIALSIIVVCWTSALWLEVRARQSDSSSGLPVSQVKLLPDRQ